MQKIIRLHTKVQGLSRQAKAGFTLIELLVVIAIIGILAGIVLASLGNARSKGSDAKVKEQLSSIRNAAEVYYATNGTYGAAVNCQSAGMGLDTTSGMLTLMTASSWPGSVIPICTTDSATAATKYAASHILSDGTYWCVDSGGKSAPSATAPGAVTACP